MMEHHFSHSHSVEHQCSHSHSVEHQRSHSHSVEHQCSHSHSVEHQCSHSHSVEHQCSHSHSVEHQCSHSHSVEHQCSHSHSVEHQCSHSHSVEHQCSHSHNAVRDPSGECRSQPPPATYPVHKPPGKALWQVSPPPPPQHKQLTLLHVNTRYSGFRLQRKALTEGPASLSPHASVGLVHPVPCGRCSSVCTCHRPLWDNKPLYSHWLATGFEGVACQPHDGSHQTCTQRQCKKLTPTPRGRTSHRQRLN